ncbi:hypothetical protein SAMN04487774_1035 [Enterococcus faecalis]|uniref:hypothetical protein n=1 Tax=Enterococcus faecalis TaxID=1351 RepID=UPI00045B2121|nr:hypothetical protein [Enterococcus faecalis]KAJ80427.1 prophage Lp1 protein 55 [Enterococcus faecalis MTUP9]SDN56445.1 hypothetical protein SAMN04487774_1035 [Enterococcus faecalis]
MTEYIDQLVDKEGSFTHPKTLVRAIKDAEEKLLLNGGDQLNFRGVKNFVDGLQVNGKDVLTENFLTVDTCTDLHGVTKSGFYRYDENTKNIPYMESKEFANGYFFALFKDDSNGIVVFLGSYMYVEKYGNSWRQPFSPFPVKLWEGGAQTGDIITLPDEANHYKSFRFYVHCTNGIHELEANFDSGNNLFLTPVGLSDTGKGLWVVEITVNKVNERQLKIVSQKFLNTDKGTTVDQVQKSLYRIDGLRF